jgi:hypothetical protein
MDCSQSASAKFESVKSQHQLAIKRHLNGPASADESSVYALSSSSSDEDENASELGIIESVKASFQAPGGLCSQIFQAA